MGRRELPTTVLLVSTEFLQAYPDTVRALIRGHIAATELATTDPVRARTIVNDGIEEITGMDLSDGRDRLVLHLGLRLDSWR